MVKRLAVALMTFFMVSIIAPFAMAITTEKPKKQERDYLGELLEETNETMADLDRKRLEVLHDQRIKEMKKKLEKERKEKERKAKLERERKEKAEHELKEKAERERKERERKEREEQEKHAAERAEAAAGDKQSTRNDETQRIEPKAAERPTKTTKNNSKETSSSREVRKTNTEQASDLFYRIVEAEARDESYRGKVAVAIVILNRVDSEDFPNTIEGVINESGQFSPMSDGSINTVTVSSDTRKAVAEALTRSDRLGGAVWFMNPEAASTNWIADTQTEVTRIGGHVFYK